jgi:FAD/FMN-containing dehydrogenase/Fe-S oxidoreductase
MSGSALHAGIEDLARMRAARKRRATPGTRHLPPQIDVDGLRARLERDVRGEVRFDPGTLAVYSTDSSNYRQPPIGVVVPLDEDDVVAAVRACHAFGAPVFPRGCGTSLSGETTNNAVCIDTSKYLREILEVDAERAIARVQPGVIRDQLSERTEAGHHLTFAPDTSTHSYATFGGMIGNNSCGIHSIMAGRTSDNVEELDVVLYDGTRMTVGNHSEQEAEEIIAAGGRRGELYAKLRDLRDRYAQVIRERYPDIPRRVSGYNLDDLLPERGFNVARALVGSEGTLATVLGATVRLVHSPPARATLVLGYPTVFEAADHVTEIMRFGPTGLEAMDGRLRWNMEIQGTHIPDLPLLPEGEGWLLVEFGGASQEEAHDKARRCMEHLEGDEITPSMRLFDDLEEASRLWGMREGGLGATSFVPGERDHWPGWEDAAVPPERLGGYLREFRDLLERYDYRAALYGHFGQGCVHCRISFDLRTASGLREWRRFLDEACDLVLEHGGVPSGEHGDGQQRAELLPKVYGEELIEAFREFKRIWDPDWKMNPGKVVDTNRILDDLVLGADYSPPEVRTHFSYPDDGGSFAHATLRCVGAGKCRDAKSGTMCPSFQVLKEEEHTTRGRARILFEMLEGETITEGWRSDHVHEALDLCLSCKGCKHDCPVKVDMATLKSEFLSKYFKGRPRPAYAYSMGLIMFHARLASKAPRLANAITQTTPLRKLAQRAGGLSTERPMPPFAPQTFKAWFRDRGGPTNPDGAPVVLFADTFNNFFHPEVAKAACDVLEAAGRRVIVPQAPLCCGRPLYDYGMLPTAKRMLDGLIRGLRPFAQAGVPVVGLEPSCIASFRDELPNLHPHDEDAKRLSQQTLTLAEYLTGHAGDWEVPRLERKAVLHGHCHHKAVMQMKADNEVLQQMGLDYEGLDSGCCGLAGSWGFEAGKHELSMQIGERVLLPAVRDAAADTLLLADGFSCKTQIDDAGTGRRALHLGQVLKMALDHGPHGVPGPKPEDAYPDVVL